MMLIGCDRLFAVDLLASPDAAVGYGALVLNDHPVSYLPLDDTAGIKVRNLVAGQPEGLLQGNVTLGAAPPFPEAVHAMGFDGASGGIDLGNAFGFVGNATFSVEAWVLPDFISDGFYTVISKRDDDVPQQGWLLFGAKDPGRGTYFAYSRQFSGTASSYASGDFVSPPVVWHHVVGTYDGATTAYYFDGKQVDTQTVAASVPSTTAELTIGCASSDPMAAVWRGAIAQGSDLRPRADRATDRRPLHRRAPVMIYCMAGRAWPVGPAVML